MQFPLSRMFLFVHCLAFYKEFQFIHSYRNDRISRNGDHLLFCKTDARYVRRIMLLFLKIMVGSFQTHHMNS